MRVQLSVKHSGPTLRGVGKQVPFAAALAINRTLEEGQTAMRAQIARDFKVRRPTFISRLVKIENKDRARKDRLVGRMGIQGARADLLAKFETDGVKLPAKGGRSIAIPVAAKRSGSDIIRADQRPRRLIGSKSSRAFIITTKDGKRLLLQRYGRRKGSRVRLLYNLSARAKIKARLHFIRTVDPVIRMRLPINFHGYLVRAISSAKP